MTYQLAARRLTLVTAILVAIALTLFLTAPFGKSVALAQANGPGGNSPATGLPTIGGTVQVGETLTADTSDIADADGLTGATFSYQWLSSRDTEIDGATTSTYTLVKTDEGKAIKVRISFTDDADNQEMLTSAPTAAVAAPAQADSEDEPSELSYLTVVVTEDDSDPDNVVTTFTITWNDAEDCSASYNAYLDGVVGDPIHLGSAASEGEQIAASLTNVSAESIGFDAKLYCGMIGSGRLVDSLMIPEYSRSFDTVPISRAYLPKPGTYSTEPGLTVLTVSPGTLTPAFHSQTLNYTVPDVANADGRITLTTTTKADYYTVAFLPGSLYFYISSCSHGGQQTSVSYQDDTGNPLYPLTDADANTPGFQMELDEGENVFKIRVWPNCESGHVYKLTVTRAANAPANTPATGAPTIGGAAQVGETLTVDTSGIADADGLSGATFSYQWLSSRDTEIQGATDAAYILVPGDASKTIKVRVSFTDDEGNAETLTSAATGAVAPRPNSPATGAPTIGGTAQVGETLTVETSGIADADGLTGATFSYQWLSSRDTEIGGATSSTYTLVAADEGKAIKVRISFTDDADNQEMLTSVATTAVAGAVDSGAPSYITVEVTEDYSDPINIVTNFAITWSDAAVCSVDYNAYLNIKPSTLTGDETEGSQLHLGSAASDGAQITAGLTGVQGGIRGFDVELYCDTDGSGRLVSRVVIPGEYTRPRPGTYSSEPPLSALGVSHGTMTPTFQGGTGSYTVPDVANAETRTTITATPTEGNFVKFFEGSDSPVIGLIVDAWGLGPRPSGLSEDCSRGFGDYYGPLIEMTDADPDTPGFQMDLYDGTSSLWVHVYPTAICSLGKSYALTITRAEGEISLPRPNRPAIGLPVIAPPGRDPGSPGTYLYFASPCVGCTMNAYVSSIKDRDGWDESTFSYQWLADDADITGATDFSYTVADIDLGKTLKVRVSFTDGRGNEETLTSLATEVVKLRNFWPTGKPVILGTAEVGQTLRVDVSGISDPNGMTNAAFTYQWVNTPWTDSNEYTLADRDEGNGIWLRVAYTDDAGHLEVLESERTAVVSARPSRPATGAPTITGTAQVGETLTADTSGIADADGLTGATFSYQWLGSRDTEIQGATNATYTLVTADEDKAIKVRVSFTDDAGNEEALTSEATAAVAAALPPPPDNVRAVTQESSAVELTWDAPDDATVTGYRIDRRRAGEGLRDNHTLVEDTGSPDTSYTDQSAGKGVEYEYRVSARNEAGAGEGSDWVRAGPEPVWGDGPPGAPRNLTVAAGDQELTLSWELPDDNGNPTATRYRIEWRIDGKDYKKGHWGTSGSTTYTKTDLANGVKYVFRVKAENGNGNSYGPYGPASEEVSATPTSGSAVDLGTPVLSNTKTLHHGMVQLDWQDIEDAGWYVVQYYHVKSGEWLDLPTAGVDIAFHGSSAVVSNLHGLSWLRVRAMSCAGESEWSQIEELYGTKASDWEDVPVPEVAEGDQIDPCPVILGTPVLSNTKTLHHGMVRLDWQDIEDAGWHVVQYYHVKSGEWLDLPAAGVDIVFHGSSAVVSNLHGLSWLRVRAMSCAGESEWSQIEELYGTKASDWEGVPVPDVAEGDEIKPCDEDADTSDNSPATGAPTISGTVQVGETLTADTSGIADADGLANATFSYKWITDDSVIVASAARTYTPTDGDRGKSVKVRVSFTDDEGNDESLTSANTATVEAQANSPATGLPTISGTAQVGETLTANTSGVADVDRLSNVQYEYQWIANDSSISGATNATYTLVAAYEGQVIRVRVSFTDDAGNNETLTSAGTAAVSAANTPATGAPTISGTAQVGETLTANTSGVADVDGLSNVQYEYRWLANDSSISGATNATYTLVAAYEGQVIKVRASFTDDAGNNETLTSAATKAVAAANTPATGAPTIIGTAQVGEALTVDTSGIADAEGLTNVLFTYQWLADDADINGAIGSTYTMEEADEGKTIKVTVSFTDDADNEETLTSVATTAVAGAAPAISGGPSYITVEVTEDSSDPNNIVTNFTITWSNDSFCSVGYNAYLKTRTGDETEGSQLHLGSAASDGAQITAGLTGVQGGVFGFDVELYCGTDESGRLVSRRFISTTNGRPWPHIYSSEPPLSALSVSHGTFIPTFNSYTSDYTIPDVANADTRITITAIPKTGYAVEFFESSGNGVSGLAVYSPGASGLSSDCNRSHFDALGPLIELTDADPNTAGFQVDLYDGENHVEVAVYPTEYCAAGRGTRSGYGLAITRAEGSISLIRPNRPPTGLPGVGSFYFRGNYAGELPCVGCASTATTSHIRDRDGMANAIFSYQWLADDAEITGAISSSYTVATADLGKTLKVRVSFTDDRGTVETLTSGATKVVKLRNFNPTGRPIVLGTLEVGQTLRADVSGISDRNGMTNTTFTYQWINSYQYSAGGSADGEEYTLVDGDAGRRIAVRVNYMDDAGHEEMLDSEITGEVAPQSNSPATGDPTISGTAQVGETLTVDTSDIADADGLDDVSFTYQWLADDTEIAGATGSTYTVAAADEGKAIKVRVTYTDDADNEETLTSAATAAVAGAQPTEPPARPTGLSATASHDSVTLTWDDPGDDSITGYVILRRVRENDVGGEFSVLVPDTGSASTTYTDDTVVAETTYTYRIKAINGAGTSERSRWFHIDTPAAPVPDKPTGLSATASHDAITLTWDDPGDDSITGYVILRRLRYDDPEGHFDELVADTRTAATTYTDDTVKASTSYTYRIKAINEGGVSERSRWFHIDTLAAPDPAGSS